MAHRKKVPVLTILALIACVAPTKLVVFKLVGFIQVRPVLAQITTAQTDVDDPSIEDGELKSDSDQPAERGRWWWLLLPLAGLALLIWAANKSIDEEKTDYTLDADSDTAQSDRISSSFDNDISTSAEQIAHEQIAHADATNPKMPDAAISNADTSLPSVVALEPAEEELSADSVATNSNPNEAIAIVGTAQTERPMPNDRQDDSTAAEASVPINSGAKHSNSDSDSDSGDVSRSIVDGIGAESIDSASKSTVRESLGRTHSDIRESTGPSDNGDWLQRAKQRINEATEQMKQATAEIEDDATRER